MNVIIKFMGHRKNTKGSQVKWTEEGISKGLLKFKLENGRFPSADEIDNYDYLPTSRSIQRSHGGLVSLRRKLFPEYENEHNLTKGMARSNKAREADARAKKYEEEFYDFLCNHISPIAIHEQKRIRPGGVSSDFYIYKNESDGFVIDLFYAQDVKTMAKVVNIKLKRYLLLGSKDIFFVLVGNGGISQFEIDKIVANKNVPLPYNIKIKSENEFKTKEILSIKQISNYSINLTSI